MESSENIFSFEQIRVRSAIVSTLIFEEIRKEVAEYLLGESDDTDSTDGASDFLTTLSEKIQKEFDELLDGNNDKKRFLRSLTTIFALLLITKVDTPDKIKKNYPFKIKLTLPKQKTVNITVNIKKNGQVLKSINTRRKSKYFTGRNQLIFNSSNIFYLINHI